MRAAGVRVFCTTIVCLALLANGNGVAFAQLENGSIDAAAAKLAAEIVRHLAAKSELNGAISIGAFEGPPAFPNSSNNLIRLALATELTRREVPLRPNGGTEVNGRYSLPEGEKNRSGIRVEARVLNRLGEESARFTAFVTDADEMARLVGATIAPATEADTKTGRPAQLSEILEERQTQIQKCFAHPSLAVSASPTGTEKEIPSVVAATADSPYCMELLIHDTNKDRYRPVAVKDHHGMGLVSMEGPERFAIRLINKADHDVGVKLYVDGLNMYEFTRVEPYRKLQVEWVPARSSVTVKGWHVDETRTSPFSLNGPPEPLNIDLKHWPGQTRCVTAVFFPSWTGSDPPSVELVGRARSGASLLGTGMGERIRAKHGERVAHFGTTVLANVSLRYLVPENFEPTATKP